MKLDAARAYTDQDIDIFPLNGKLPANKGWQAEATTEFDEDWFGPYNIGVACGDGLLVVDIDVKDGRDGLAWDRLSLLGGTTLAIQTGSGGFHYYFWYDPEKWNIKSTIGRLHKDVDTRGDGGYVVGAASIVDGKPYAVVENIPIADAPDWLLEELHVTPGQGSDVAPGERDFTDDDRAALSFLAADDYDEWVLVCCAMRYTFGDAALPEFIAWSMKSAKFTSAADCEKKWQSFKIGDRAPEDSIKFATVQRMAREAGWRQSSSIEASLDAIAETQREMTGDEIIEWISQQLPDVDKHSLPDLLETAAGNTAMAQAVTIRNILYICDILGVSCKHNVLTKRDELEFNDKDLQEAVERLQEPQAAISEIVWAQAQLVGMRSASQFDGVLGVLCKERMYHPIADWMEDIEWDGDDWIGRLADTVELGEDEDRGLWRRYLERWLIGAVQACHGWADPQQIRGCLVMAGPQECGKTTWFKALTPLGAFKEGVALGMSGGSISGDAVRIATSGLICELGELETTFKKAESGAIKNFLTVTHDEYRMPYARRAYMYPRATVFCGTVNRVDFLRDSTGSARFWPVSVKSCDAKHELDVGQIWAQARELWAAGESWFLDDEESEARASREDDFAERSMIDERLEEIFQSVTRELPLVGVTASMALEAIGVSKPAPWELAAAGAALTRLTGKPRGRAGKTIRHGWWVPLTAEFARVTGQPTTLEAVK